MRVPMLEQGRVLAMNRGPGGPSQQEPSTEHVIRSDERHRIARDLHDSTAQLLVLLRLQLRRLRDAGEPEAEYLIDECERAISEVREHIRRLDSD